MDANGVIPIIRTAHTRTTLVVVKSAMRTSILAVALTGCFASRPSGNVGFGTAHTLSELAGTYLNLGEAKEQGHYLSRIIWPSDTTVFHESIYSISVQAIGDTVLAVHAIGGTGVVKEGLFVSGKDFQFTNGRLRLPTKVENTLKTPEAGGLFVVRTTRELGLDK